MKKTYQLKYQHHTDTNDTSAHMKVHISDVKTQQITAALNIQTDNHDIHPKLLPMINGGKNRAPTEQQLNNQEALRVCELYILNDGDRASQTERRSL